jgi:hypothetical protein
MARPCTAQRFVQVNRAQPARPQLARRSELFTCGTSVVEHVVTNSASQFLYAYSVVKLTKMMVRGHAGRNGAFGIAAHAWFRALVRCA